MKLALNLLEHLRLDQAGHRYRDDLLFRLALPVREEVLLNCHWPM